MDAIGPSRRAPASACAVCGLPLEASPGECPNPLCHRGDRAFSVVYPVGLYAGAMRHSLLRYKYKREMWLSAVFAGGLARYLRARATWFEEFDLIVGVPSYTGAGSRRGWDPVAGILDQVRPLVGPSWQVSGGVVVKTSETVPMQRLAGAERRRSAEGDLRRSLLVARPAEVDGARVLLFDDVMTEGSTLREVARALRGAGAEEVAGLVLARLPWSPVPPAHVGPPV